MAAKYSFQKCYEQPQVLLSPKSERFPSSLKFDCSNNRLKELPASLGRCVDLSEFKASKNSLTSLPEDLANCLKLMKFDVEGNKLTVLLENLLNSWTMLTELNADKIGTLSRLIRLDLHQNTEMGALSRLGTLDLHSNQLKEYPVEACKLRLSVLDLSNNSLSGLPPEIASLVNLELRSSWHSCHPPGWLFSCQEMTVLKESFLTYSISLRFLLTITTKFSNAASGSASSPSKDDCISMATRLSLSSKELSLVGLGLSSVPPAVWESDEVVKVDLSRNEIHELPNLLSSCSSLQALILSGNKIKEWPGAVLASLANLLCLKIDNNPLAQIPPNGFEGLSKLQILDLSGCAASLPEPSGLSCLPQLQELHLRRVQLQEIPSDIPRLLQLRILDLSQNSLVFAPKELKNLTSLIELDLSDNNMTALPPELGLLEPNLQVLKVDGNPLRSIRRAIIDRGTKAVLKYLKDKLPGGESVPGSGGSQLDETQPVKNGEFCLSLSNCNRNCNTQNKTLPSLPTILLFFNSQKMVFKIVKKTPTKPTEDLQRQWRKLLEDPAQDHHHSLFDRHLRAAPAAAEQEQDNEGAAVAPKQLPPSVFSEKKTAFLDVDETLVH
ncbi:hypothetical protein ACLOJK_024562 [Asimina triloba]